MIRPICPHCNNYTVMTSGMLVVPKDPDLKHKRFYFCRQCDAYTGVKRDGTPVGIPGDLKTRKARERLKKAIQQLKIEDMTLTQCLLAIKGLKR